jgi:hypothetical protein
MIMRRSRRLAENGEGRAVALSNIATPRVKRDVEKLPTLSEIRGPSRRFGSTPLPECGARRSKEAAAPEAETGEFYG